MASLDSIEILLSEFKKNTEEHLVRLNGKVEKNTRFRNMAYGGFAVLSFLGIGTLFGFILLWTKVAN